MSKHLFGKCTFVQLCFLAAMALALLPVGTVDAASASVSQTSTVSGFAYSCSDEDEGSGVTETVVSKSEMRFVKGGETQILSVLSSVQPEVASGADWCSVSYVSVTQRGTYTYNVEVGANPETDDRSTTISVTAGGFSATVQVTQTAADALIAGQHDYTVSGNGEDFSVTMQTTGTYEVVCDAGWIHPDADVSRALSEMTENFTVDANVSGAERSATITFALADVTETVTVTQGVADASIEADNTGMEQNAKELLKNVTVGWNLGNSMEVPEGETGWGNPATTKAMIDGVKGLGFNSVRIPCAWDSYILEGSDNVIDPTWLARVKEVVDYCVGNDMYTILNIHWDGGWLENNIWKGVLPEVEQKQKALWTQIATFFRDYDERLLFAGCNEPAVAADADSVATLLHYEQNFIDAVRETGGKNSYRNLIVQGPSTDIDKTNTWMNELPEDNTVSGRLIMEVHYYTPSDFCLMKNDGDYGSGSLVRYFWGKENQSYATGDYANRYATSDEDDMQELFEKMKTKFVDKGVPVIIGEFAPAVKRTLPDATAQEGHDKSRAYFNKCVVSKARALGITPYYWDAGSGVFNRLSLSVCDQMELNGLMEGAQTPYPAN